MAAITWRTVMSQSLAEASRPLEAASKSITGAFDRFGSVISDYEAGQQKIVDRGDEAKVLAFREALAAAKSKEAVAAIEQGRDQALSGVAPKFRAPTVGAEDARLSAIYKNTVEARAADDSNMEFQHRATVEKAKALSAAGDVNGANALIATLPENFLGRGTLAAGAVTGDRATQTFKDSLLTTKSQREVAATGAINQTATAAAATSNAATNATQAQTQARQVQLQADERAAAARVATAEKLAAADKTTIGSTEGFNAVMDRVSKIVDKQHLGKITAFTAEALASNPEFRKLPVDVVETIILRRANNIKDTINPFSWIANWGSASDIANDLKGALAEPAIQKRILEGELSRQVLRTRLAAPPPSLNGAQGPALVDAAVARAPVSPGAVIPAGALQQESSLRGAAQLSPAEQANSNAYESSPGNLASLRKAISSEKDPAIRALLNTELEKQTAIAATIPVSATVPAPPAPTKVADRPFQLNAALEQKAEEQLLQMGMSDRQQFTADVRQYLKQKSLAIAELNKEVPPGPNPAAKFTAGPFTLAEAIARRQQADQAKKAK